MQKRTQLEEHYNKFSEEKRLTRRHGQVEFLTSMRYIKKYLEQLEVVKEKGEISILDIGAGTGRYSVALAEEGYDVTAIELVKYNVGILKRKSSTVKAFQGNALNLKKCEDDSFDVTLLFGPMYHLFQEEDKLKALEEAKRVTKKGGIIFVAYLMNEYSILVHGFRDNYILECMENGQVTEDFHVRNTEKDLYDYVRIEDIDRLNETVGLQRLQIIAVTGAANYIRPTLHNMDEKTFGAFMEYHFATCERADLMGMSSHTVDILKK
ncbi:MAG: methyltransferase domain-containing protein [Eubacteriales bacterium]